MMAMMIVIVMVAAAINRRCGLFTVLALGHAQLLW